MTNPFRLPSPWRIVLLALLLLAAPRHSAAEDAGRHWVCPPCGAPCDAKVFDHPGTCPECGMTLVDASTVSHAPDTRIKVGILVFNGVEIIDSTGPYEIFGAADYDVFTIAKMPAPLRRPAARYGSTDSRPSQGFTVSASARGGEPSRYASA